MSNFNRHTIHRHHTHHGWDNANPAALEIESGDVVELDIVDASGGQLGPSSTAADIARLDFERVNPVTGPVYVHGARPGDVLQVDLLEFGASDWGWTAIIPGFGLLADAFPEPALKIWQFDAGMREAVFRDDVRIPIHPFPGTIGVAPSEAGHHSVVPPRSCGGNLDIRHLTAGTTLFLPVQVDGALFSAGDTHAAQGDGEVCGTAIETALRVSARLTVRRDLRIRQPQFVVPHPLHSGRDPRGYWATTGIADDLHEAARMAVRHMLEHLVDQHGMSDEEAYMLASVAVDLSISEIVDAPNWVVSAFLPQSIVRR